MINLYALSFVESPSPENNEYLHPPTRVHILGPRILKYTTIHLSYLSLTRSVWLVRVCRSPSAGTPSGTSIAALSSDHITISKQVPEGGVSAAHRQQDKQGCRPDSTVLCAIKGRPGWVANTMKAMPRRQETMECVVKGRFSRSKEAIANKGESLTF